MGYHTNFKGSFNLDRPLTPEHADRLRNLEARLPSSRSTSRCQWVPTSGGTKIEWDGEEKFYDYVEWLEYMLERFLGPWGYKLNGKVAWSGDDVEDVGVIIVTDNVIKARNFHGEMPSDVESRLARGEDPRVVVSKTLNTVAVTTCRGQRSEHEARIIMRDRPSGTFDPPGPSEDMVRRFAFRWILVIDGTQGQWYLSDLSSDRETLSIDAGQDWTLVNAREIIREAKELA